MVLKHYFKPGREDFSKAINAAMPKFLGEPEKPLPDPRITEVLTILDQTSAKTWRKDAERIRELVGRFESDQGPI